MSATAARDELVSAVRRDLFGPRDGDKAPWPGVEPRLVTTATSFEAWRDVIGAFVDDEGNEVLSGSPLRRYGIGVLFPKNLSREVEEALDAAQSDAADEAAEAEADASSGPLPPPEVTKDDDSPESHAAPDDADVVDPPFRPRSMAVSFLVAADAHGDLVVELSGGRYEPLELRVGGNPATFWRRRPLSLQVKAPAQGGDSSTDLTDGSLQLRVGIARRSHAAGTIVTAYVTNVTPAAKDLVAASRAALMQAELTVRAPAGTIAKYPTADALSEPTLELLYHRNAVRAVGHGCNAEYQLVDETDVVVANHFPVEVVRSPVPDAVDEQGNPLLVDMDGLSRWDPEARHAVTAILQAYRVWIDGRRSEIDQLPARLLPIARRHLDACEAFLQDASSGWDLTHRDANVEKVLRWTSEAMANQRRAYAASTRPLIFDDTGKTVRGVSGADPHAEGSKAAARWRAFQIAFLLGSIESVVDPDAPRAEVVDIIWMPTGGGKTEAYSAVAAFTILWRRFTQVRSGALPAGQGATVLMRYTLRLLTAQQLQRAAALICALELIRRSNTDELGSGRKFSIGAWLGRKSTPNDWSGARTALTGWKQDPTKRGFLLTRCPWCATAIGRRSGPGTREVDGYRTIPAPNASESRVMAYCPNERCRFNDGLPVYEVDEDLYLQSPTFIVGTIDKFAMLAWRTEPAGFFGLRGGQRGGPGPALLIQDELHLISGPLGSLDALYEPVIEDLCERDGGQRPRILAATATTRRYQEQTAALYGRTETRLIPPPGLDAADNFFSRTNPDAPGKLFVGIFAPAFGKAQEAQIRTIAALGHAGGSLDAAGYPADPWWTNLMFFSSRRSLGLVQSLVQTHLRSHSWRLHRATGVDAGPPRQTTGTRLTVRSMNRRVELTAQATSDVSEAMDQLAIPMGEKAAADLCFATSMIEVGVDIDRLGLMTMFGQPKSASQYIQVAGRVGRNESDAPGVVFVLLSPFNSRDRSHFEQFSTFHRRLYASVEPVSITPYTPAALERGLAGALTAWLRQAAAPTAPADAVGSMRAAYEAIARRVQTGSKDQARLEAEFANLEQLLRATSHDQWGSLAPGSAGAGFLRPLADLVAPSATSPDAVNTQWLVPTSMRSVDAEAGTRAIRHVKSGSADAALPRGASTATSDEDLI